MININLRNPKPIYEQIKNEFRKLISAGIISEGEKLPSVRELSASISINPNTIQRAYRDLEAEGTIYSVPGKGSFASGALSAVNNRKNELLDKMKSLVSELKATGMSSEELSQTLQEYYKEV